MRGKSCLMAALMLPVVALAFTPDTSNLSAVPRLQLDAAQVQSDIAAQTSALRFAVGEPLAADTSSGVWDADDGSGIARWRLRIASPGAISLNLQLSALQLPAQAELWLYSADGSDPQGPYTAQDNGVLWTAIVRSDEAVLEARVPSAAKDQFSLKIAQAFHGYRSLDSGEYVAKGYFGTSGSCTIDAACSDGDNWRPEIRSAVLLTIAGNTLCSGTLVNNTAQDDRGLVLTANHCGVTASTVTSTKVYFNVQRASCGSGADGAVSQNISGKTVLAGTTSGTFTDYTLFELAIKPPSSYNVHYAGWDVDGTAPSSGVGLSHPAGDNTKISSFINPGSASFNRCIGTSNVGGVCVGFNINAWAIIWTKGITQPGSSGSGLWNQDHRVVGTLSGGNSACSTSTPTLGNGGIDLYARLDQAWAASSVTGSTLKQVLDAGNTGCVSLPGKDPGSANTVSCNGTSASGGSSSGDAGSGSTSGSGSAAASSGSGGGGFSLTLSLALLGFTAIRALLRRAAR